MPIEVSELTQNFEFQFSGIECVPSELDWKVFNDRFDSVL